MRFINKIVYSKQEVGPGTCPASMENGIPCGRPIWEPDGVVCLCHSSRPEKDSSEMAVEIGRMMEEGDGDFTQFVFPSGFEFVGSKFSGETFWDGAHFLGDISFHEAEFKRKATFSGIPTEEGIRPFVFEGRVSFVAAVFHEIAFFCCTVFRDRVSFAWAHFYEGAAFSSYWFKDTAEEIVVSFDGDADFRLSRQCRAPGAEGRCPRL